ncbi:MAG: hypothetical protein IPM56_14040 [Ignavibacteriales bacterium]|nr:MAG: hypothetical protein IPM56_14040 [Ignavibacteriales bacterium]
MFQLNYYKKIISYFAITLLLYNSCGYVLVYLPLIHITKYEVEQQIEDGELKKDLIKLSFQKSDIKNGLVNLQWKHSKEFRYNDEMYDIVEEYESSDSIHYICHHDKKEKELEKNLSKHYEKDDARKNSRSTRNIIIQQVTDLFSYPEINNYQQISKQTYLVSTEYIAELNDPEVPTPPPKSFI